MKQLSPKETLREALHALERLQRKRLASWYLYSNGAPCLGNVLAYHANRTGPVAPGAFFSHRRFRLGGRRFKYDESMFLTLCFRVAEDYLFKQNDELSQARRYRFVVGYLKRALNNLEGLPAYVDREGANLRWYAEEMPQAA